MNKDFNMIYHLFLLTEMLFIESVFNSTVHSFNLMFYFSVLLQGFGYYFLQIHILEQCHILNISVKYYFSLVFQKF